MLVDVDGHRQFVADGDGGGAASCRSRASTITGGRSPATGPRSAAGRCRRGRSMRSGSRVRTFAGNHAGALAEGRPGDGSGGALASGGWASSRSPTSVLRGGTSPLREGGALFLGNNGSVASPTPWSARTTRGPEAAASRTPPPESRHAPAGHRQPRRPRRWRHREPGQRAVRDRRLDDQSQHRRERRRVRELRRRCDRMSRARCSGTNRAIVGLSDDAGLGGGIYGLGDAGASYENITITGNFAQTRGGGFYVDADAGVRVSSSTIVGNSAPIASGAGGEIGSLNVPIYPSLSVIFRNTIVAGNLIGPNCSFAPSVPRAATSRATPRATSAAPADRTIGRSRPRRGRRQRWRHDDDGDPARELRGRRRRAGRARSPTSAVCARPQNDGCDSGAYESEGPFPAPDLLPPDARTMPGRSRTPRRRRRSASAAPTTPRPPIS